MAQQVKVLIVQAWQPEFQSLDPCIKSRTMAHICNSALLWEDERQREIEQSFAGWYTQLKSKDKERDPASKLR